MVFLFPYICISKFDDEYYSFSYKYIYYFLIAQKISSEIEKYQELIYELCNKIHLEVNANKYWMNNNE